MRGARDRNGHRVAARALVLAAACGLAVAAGTGSLGCRVLLGEVNECTTTADCAGKAFGAVCQSNLCVSDPRCTTYGTPGPGTLLIGAILARTNPGGMGADQAGILSSDAVSLAAQQINGSGGDSVHPVAVISCDNSFDGPTSAELAQELVDQGVVAIVTDGSTDTTSVASVTIPAGVLVIASWATSIQIGQLGVSATGGPKMVWSTAVPDSVQGKVMGSLLLDGGVRAPAIVSRNDLYGTGLTDSITQTYQLLTDGGAIPAALYPPGGDASAAVAQTEPDHPDGVVLIGLSSEDDGVLEDWTDPDPRTWYFTDAAESSQTISALPNGPARLVGHALGTGPGVDEGTSAYQDFATQFESAFAQDPATQSFVPNTYDAAMLIVVGAAWASLNNGLGIVNGTQIAEGLSHVEAPLPDGGAAIPLEPEYLPTITAAFTHGMDVNVQGASGKLDFDPATGVAPGPIAIWTFLEDAGIQTIDTVSP